MLRPFIEWSKYTDNFDELYEKLQKVKKDFLGGTEYHLGLFDTDTSNLLQSIKVYPGSKKNPFSMEVNLWDAPKVADEELQVLTLRLVLVIAFTCLQCDRAQIVCNKDNEQAIALTEHCNFVYEGILRNYFSPWTEELITKNASVDRSANCYSMIYDEYKQAPWVEKIINSTTLYSMEDKSYPMVELLDYYNSLREKGLYP